MKLPFLLSLSLHLGFFIVFGAVSRLPTFEDSDNTALSQVSLVRLSSYNAIISEPPLIIERQALTDLEEKLNDKQDLNELTLQQENSKFNYETPSIELLYSLEESSHELAFDTSFVSPREILLDNKRYFQTNTHIYKGQAIAQNNLLDSGQQRVGSFIGLSPSIKSLAIRDLGKEDAVLFQGNSGVELNINPENYRHLEFSKMVDQRMTSYGIKNGLPKSEIVTPIHFIENKLLVALQTTKDMNLKVAVTEIFAASATNIKDNDPEILSHKAVHQNQFNQVSKKNSNRGSLKAHKVRKNELKVWGSSIQTKIYANLTYPRLALAKKIGGKVTIQLKITKEGRLTKLKILKSSGFSILDEEALRATQQVQGFPSAPRSLIRPVYSFSLPIKFEL